MGLAFYSPIPRPSLRLPDAYSELRGQSTVGQQGHVPPKPGVCCGGLDGQHLHTRAWLGCHCREDSTATERWVGPARPAPTPRLRSLDAPNSDTFSHLASRSLSRSHNWHCLARRSQSLTCSTPTSRRPVGVQCGGSGPRGTLSSPQAQFHKRWPPAQPLGYRARTPRSTCCPGFAILSSTGPKTDGKGLSLLGVQTLPEQTHQLTVSQTNPTQGHLDRNVAPSQLPHLGLECHLCTGTAAGPQRPQD